MRKSSCRKWGDCETCPFSDCKDESRHTYNAEYYESNKERLRAYQREYRKTHPRMQYEANKKWAKNNRDRKNELQRAYRQRVKQRIIEESLNAV